MTLAHIHPSLRLAMSALVIFGVLAAVAGVSSALLVTNPVTATDNTFSTASVGLEIAPDSTGTPGTYSTTMPGFTQGGLVPGDTRNFTFWLRNTSTDAVELNLRADLANFLFQDSAANPLDGTATDLDTKLLVGFNCDVQNSANDGTTVTDDLNGWTAAAGASKPFTNTGAAILGTTTDTDEALCTMTVTLDATAATASGHTAIFDAIFTGEQVAPAI